MIKKIFQILFVIFNFIFLLNCTNHNVLLKDEKSFENELKVTISSDKSVLRKNDSVEIIYKFKNISDDIVLLFNSDYFKIKIEKSFSNFRPYDNFNITFGWGPSVDYLMLESFPLEILEPGKSKTYRIVKSFKDLENQLNNNILYLNLNLLYYIIPHSEKSNITQTLDGELMFANKYKLMERYFPFIESKVLITLDRKWVPNRRYK